MLTVDDATARRFGLAKKRSGRVVVARGKGGREFKGNRRFSVRFTKSARTLRGARRLRVRLGATGIAGGTDRRTQASTLTLSR